MYDITEARHVERYKLELTFEDGKKGTVNLEGYLKKGGLFSRFSDFEYFKRFYVNRELGALCWPEGLDIAPEILYHRPTSLYRLGRTKAGKRLFEGGRVERECLIKHTVHTVVEVYYGVNRSEISIFLYKAMCSTPIVD